MKQEIYSRLIYRRKSNVKATLEDYMFEQKEIIEQDIVSKLQIPTTPEILQESMLYSLTAGGKRLRPILLYASYETYGKRSNRVRNVALALEMIHTYSLIHDDLPALDNDDFRRGKKTNHKVFEESTAILAGDALLTHSFHLIATDEELTDEEKVQLITWLTEASGPTGMVAGQILDIEAENKEVSLYTMEKVHALKTGKLISFAVQAGAYLGGATEEQQKHLQTFSHFLGILFQIQDDILDITGNVEKMGKPIGSDVENNKSTYPGMLGLNKAKEYRDYYYTEALTALTNAGADHYYMKDLTHYFAERDY